MISPHFHKDYRGNAHDIKFIQCSVWQETSRGTRLMHYDLVPAYHQPRITYDTPGSFCQCFYCDGIVAGWPGMSKE